MFLFTIYQSPLLFLTLTIHSNKFYARVSVLCIKGWSTLMMLQVMWHNLFCCLRNILLWSVRNGEAMITSKFSVSLLWMYTVVFLTFTLGELVNMFWFGLQKWIACLRKKYIIYKGFQTHYCCASCRITALLCQLEADWLIPEGSLQWDAWLLGWFRS